MAKHTPQTYGLTDDGHDPWITEAVLEFTTIAGLFVMLFGLFFLFDAGFASPFLGG